MNAWSAIALFDGALAVVMAVEWRQVATITDPLTHTTTFEYDAAGNRKSVTDALTREEWLRALRAHGIEAEPSLHKSSFWNP